MLSFERFHRNHSYSFGHFRWNILKQILCLNQLLHVYFRHLLAFSSNYITGEWVPASLSWSEHTVCWRIKYHPITGHQSRFFIYPFYSLWLQQTHGNSNKKILRSYMALFLLGLNIKTPVIKAFRYLGSAPDIFR